MRPGRRWNGLLAAGHSLVMSPGQRGEAAGDRAGGLRVLSTSLPAAGAGGVGFLPVKMSVVKHKLLSRCTVLSGRVHLSSSPGEAASLVNG